MENKEGGMKRKYSLVVLVLILAMFLVGCSGIVTPDNDVVDDVVGENDPDFDTQSSVTSYLSTNKKMKMRIFALHFFILQR